MMSKKLLCELIKSGLVDANSLQYVEAVVHVRQLDGLKFTSIVSAWMTNTGLPVVEVSGEDTVANGYV